MSIDKHEVSANRMAIVLMAYSNLSVENARVACEAILHWQRSAGPCEAESLIWLAACDVLSNEQIKALSRRVIEMRKAGYVPARGALSRLGGFNQLEQLVSAKLEKQPKFPLGTTDLEIRLIQELMELRELIRQVSGHGVATSYLPSELRAKLAAIAS